MYIKIEVRQTIYENMVCPSHGHLLLQSRKLLTFQVML